MMKKKKYVHIYVIACCMWMMIITMVNGRRMNEKQNLLKQQRQKIGNRLRQLKNRKCFNYCHHALKYNFKACINCHASSHHNNPSLTIKQVHTLYNIMLQLNSKDLPIPNANVMGGTDYPQGQGDWDPNAGQTVGGNEDCNRQGQSWLSDCARKKTGFQGQGSMLDSALQPDIECSSGLVDWGKNCVFGSAEPGGSLIG